MILCSNPLAQYRAHDAAIDAAIARVLASGRYILGDEVKTFEAEFAAYCGVRHGIGVGSGTEALHLALRACGIGAGDEVITVSHTAVATVSAIELAGATPVLVDVESDYLTIDPAAFEAAITPRSRAVIVVHIYGQPAALNRLMPIARKHGLKVIEDCAQAHGARIDNKSGGMRVGSIGDVACFSFYPTKNLGAIGDGGMVVTDDDGIATQARSLREYGWAERYSSTVSGWNTRLDELQAAVLRVKLPTLDADNDRRRAIADRYDRGLDGLPLALPPRRADVSHVFHLYVVRSDRRDALLAHLRADNVGALIHYPVPVHRQPAYAARGLHRQTMAETERAAAEILSLPIFPELTEVDQTTVIASVRSFFGAAS
jgi:dTDP-4-amino-4,6-dideoxygalactose transaminase